MLVLTPATDSPFEIACCLEVIELASGTVRSLVERIEAVEVERVQIEAKHCARFLSAFYVNRKENME